jgi:hypothetical protein
MSNAHGSVLHSHELCLHVTDGKQTIIYNVANLLADACAMYAELNHLRVTFESIAYKLEDFLL